MPPDWVSRLPLRWRIIGKLIMSISSSPMTLLRAAGPVGPSLIQKLRPDLVSKFSQHFPAGSRAALDYIYHVNAQFPSGEEAFAALQLPGSFTWAAKPLVNRLPALDPSVGVSFLYGEHTWMDKWIGLHLKDILGQRAQFAILPDAGHHIYVDNPADFNKAVDLAIQNKLKQISDDQMDIALTKWRAHNLPSTQKASAESQPAPAPN
jgi:pimeloyl-ACP methyl ester carboxylesterase